MSKSRKDTDRTHMEFISLASHQLRTPLSTIMLNLELLSRYHADLFAHPGSKESLRAMQGASEHMLQLINALLRVSKIEAGVLEVAPRRTDVALLTHDVITSVGALAKRRGVKMVLKAPVRPLVTTTDSQLLSIVIDNLLSNAIKYSPRGSHVEVRLSRIGSSQVRFTITDKGCGIPAHQQAYVFDKLFRADNAAGQKVGGTGLGLYIAKSLLTMLGGTITFTSRENKGTTFTVTVPLR